ncbi:hypothetical protein DERP_005777 [Dermatophagoides pteronyssinus]|uniref:Uncharacterized protein n=1 Tax=Dermatophagoides pteronyssinus TaxID=6956 RepID=A0ABQ8J9K5_DERPT|nr:hypothetical protein DERP_005777 [Dermatophagoides pteronyssinus]
MLAEVIIWFMFQEVSIGQSRLIGKYDQKKNLGKFFKEKFPHSDNDEKPQAKSGQNYFSENGNKFAFEFFFFESGYFIVEYYGILTLFILSI